MKKQFLTLIAFAAGITAAYAQCGTIVTRIWDGGGADNNFFTAANWSGDVVPDCNDAISFGNQTTKDCEIPDSFITTGNIQINSSYRGRIVVSGTGTVIQAANFTMNATVITFNPEIGHCRFSNIAVGDNGMMNYASRAGITVTGTLTMNAGGFIAFRTGTTLNLNAIALNAYGQIKCPERGVVNITGNIQKAKVSTFDHRFSTWNIIGTAAQSIVASSGSSGTLGTINFWNVNLNKTNTSGSTTDNWTLNVGTDTVIVENRLTVLAGDIVGTTSNSGFMFHDTLELVGQGAQGHTGRILCGGNKTADVILNGNTNFNAATGNLIVNKESNGSVLNFRKGSGSEVTMPTNIINVERGTIAFPDDVTVNVPNGSTFTIGANAALTMPATATVKMDANTMSITGSVIANQATLEFVGSNAVGINFGGSGRKAFFNITVNMTNASLGVRVTNDTLEALNDVVIKTGLIGRLGASNVGGVFVNGDFEVQSSASTNTDPHGAVYILGGNANTQYIGDGILSSGRVVIDKTSSSNVVSAVTSGNTVLIGSLNSSNSTLDIRNGILSFEDKNGDIAAAVFNVRANGRIEAPATDTLNIRGGWNFAHRGAINPRGGTITIGSTSNTYNQNGTAVVFNNLHINNDGNKTWGTSDTIIVKGNMTLVSNATLINADLVFEGNLTRTNGGITLGSIIAAGGNTQTITTNSQDQLLDEGLIVNKSAGKVFLGSTVRLKSLRMSNGLLNTNGQSMIVLGANSIIGGNSNSYIEGTVRIESTTAWSGSRYFIPVGRGTNYRPVQLHASHTTNTWTITYVASDTVTDLGTAGTHGIDAFSTSEHWIISRIAGGGASNPVLVELSTLGKDPSWADSSIRVARWNPSTPAWVNHSPGSTGASSNMIMTTLGWTTNDTRVFTIGADNVPAPVAVRSEGISGNELDLVKNTSNGNSQAVAQSAISFNVFPNPVAETLNIALSGADKGSITLSDLSGKVLGVYSADTRSIHMSRFAAGVYFATFSNGSQRITQRVIRN